MVAEIFLFPTENLEQNYLMEQKHQEYYDNNRCDSSSEEMEDNGEINPPKDGRSVLAAHQAQVKKEEV